MVIEKLLAIISLVGAVLLIVIFVAVNKWHLWQMDNICGELDAFIVVGAFFIAILMYVGICKLFR